MKNIKELDLSGCAKLEVLPAAFAAHGIGRRLQTLTLGPQLSRALPSAATRQDWSPQKKLSAILLRQQRRQAILKLATQAEPMLTTLERMSWLLIILATITLTAFLQPGMKAVTAGNAVEMDSNECVDNAGKQFHQEQEVQKVKQNATVWFQDLSVVRQAWYICRCYTNDSMLAAYGYSTCRSYWDNSTLHSMQHALAEQQKSNSVTGACKQLVIASDECSFKELKVMRVALFAFLTVLSFCVTLFCLMLIVVVSLPRLKCTDLAYEAGRLWLFLLIIWLLFVEAVQLAFLSFWAFAVVVYDNSPIYGFSPPRSDYWHNFYYDSTERYIPYIYGFGSADMGGVSMAILVTTSLTVPALIVICVYFARIYPGHRAVHLACCSCTCTGPTQDFVYSYGNMDIEEGELGFFVSTCPPTIDKLE